MLAPIISAHAFAGGALQLPRVPGRVGRDVEHRRRWKGASAVPGRVIACARMAPAVQSPALANAPAERAGARAHAELALEAGDAAAGKALALQVCTRVGCH